MNLSRGPIRQNISDTTKNSSYASIGCWTCRLRRKKCDGKKPVCDVCSALFITCHFDQMKPVWMDGGTRQDEMIEWFKREVKDNAHRRRGALGSWVPSGGGDVRTGEADASQTHFSESLTGESFVTAPQNIPCDLATTMSDTTLNAHSAMPYSGLSDIRPDRGADCTLTSKNARGNINFGRSDTILLMFYLEHLLPFLFPFYHPSLFEGGKAWVLEMMISSPVVRQATLCQSSYFFSLEWGMATLNHKQDVAVDWETVHNTTMDAFGVLRQSLQVIDGSNIIHHLHGAVRIMASIMQVQRFEIMVLSFDNCQAHLNAALALFIQLLESPGAVEMATPNASFNAVMSRLGPTTRILPAQCAQVLSAEQAAFRFSSTLLILDDIIASTVLQKPPRLHAYHLSLLCKTQDTEPPLNLEAVVGCQNRVLLQIGQIAGLDAWKQQCKKAGNLNVIELVHRAEAIRNSLEAHLSQLESNPVSVQNDNGTLLDLFTANHYFQVNQPASQTTVATRVWAHAAFIYLFIVVSGWQPTSDEVRYNVNRIIELLTKDLSPPALLRTLVWPFCVAGCLAERAQEQCFRDLAHALKPQDVFGTVRKALCVMEKVWCDREVGSEWMRDGEGEQERDLSMCLRSGGDLMLLV